MNKLEAIAILKLRSEIIDIMDRANDKNENRFEHERIFVRGTAQRSMDVINALIENDPKNFPDFHR